MIVIILEQKHLMFNLLLKIQTFYHNNRIALYRYPSSKLVLQVTIFLHTMHFVALYQDAQKLHLIIRLAQNQNPAIKHVHLLILSSLKVPFAHLFNIILQVFLSQNKWQLNRLYEVQLKFYQQISPPFYYLQEHLLNRQ